jgi:hypothetical protein
MSECVYIYAFIIDLGRDLDSINLSFSIPPSYCVGNNICMVSRGWERLL